MSLAVSGAEIPARQSDCGRDRDVTPSWTADVGGELRRSTGAPTLDLEAPFTDDTRSVGLASGVSSYVAVVSTTAAVGSDDFAIELVFRAAPGATLFDKRSAGAGWALHEGADGAAILSVEDAAQTTATEIASRPLVADAWYHCLAWVSRAEGGRIDCNGRVGSVVPLSTLGDLDSPSSVAAGGGTASGRVALLAVYRAPRGGLGPAASWLAIGERRFATLAGAGAVALGNALPSSNLRDSPAYLDMQRSVGAARRLFLVGADWPRIACRTDSMNARDCGYISEPARMRLVSPDPGAFAANEVTVLPDQGTFVDDDARMAALIPSSATALHAISATSSFDAAHHVFSFFARAGNASRVGVSAGGLATAVYDLVAGDVVSAPAGVDATIEPWGNGVFRCAYGFDPSPGSTTYSVQLVDPADVAPSDAPFAGDGTSAALFVAGLQVDVGLHAPGSLLAADAQPADHLAFAASNGNLPSRAVISFTMRMIAPAAALRARRPADPEPEPRGPLRRASAAVRGGPIRSPQIHRSRRRRHALAHRPSDAARRRPAARPRRLVEPRVGGRHNQWGGRRRAHADAERRAVRLRSDRRGLLARDQRPFGGVGRWARFFDAVSAWPATKTPPSWH